MTYDEMQEFEYAIQDEFEELVQKYTFNEDSNYSFNLAMAYIFREDFVQAEENMRHAAKLGSVAAKSVVKQINPSDNVNNAVLKGFFSDTIQSLIEAEYPTSKKDAKLIQQYLGKFKKCLGDKKCIGNESRAREALQHVRDAASLNSHVAFSILKSIGSSF